MGSSAGVDREAQQPESPPPPCHKVGKGLMTAFGPVVTGSIQRLVSHKDYAIEMVNSIIKDVDLDGCGELSTEDLRASCLFNLSKVCGCWPYL